MVRQSRGTMMPHHLRKTVLHAVLWSIVTAVASYANALCWLGINRQKYLIADGIYAGPYRAWEVWGAVLIELLLVLLCAVKCRWAVVGIPASLFVYVMTAVNLDNGFDNFRLDAAVAVAVVSLVLSLTLAILLGTAAERLRKQRKSSSP